MDKWPYRQKKIVNFQLPMEKIQKFKSENESMNYEERLGIDMKKTLP